MTMRLGVLATHPIQYHAPLYRELARRLDLHVYFAHRQTAAGQADAGFGVAFEWDVDLTEGYSHSFLTNQSAQPGTDTFAGCDTPEIRSAIATNQFDAFLVTGWYNRSYWQAIRACWQTGTPLLVRGDSHLGSPRSRLRQAVKAVAYRAFIPRFDAYLAVGQRNREYYLHYGANPNRLFDAPHFVDTNAFESASAAARTRRTALREANAFRADSRVLLFAGKFTDVKRPVDFVEAVARLAVREPDVEGAMVGDGPLRHHVELAIARTGAPVRLLGFRNQSDMPSMYALSDALALPSAHETWGLVVNEAQACGLPAVVTDVVGCAPDLIDEVATGLTFPVGNLDAFEDAAGRVLRWSESSETAAALRTVTQAHSVGVAADGVLAAVTSLCTPPSLTP